MKKYVWFIWFLFAAMSCNNPVIVKEPTNGTTTAINKVVSVSPHFTMTLANDIQVSNNEYDFDIFILRSGADTFQMRGCQLASIYNAVILGAGNLTCSYVSSSTSAEIVSGSMQNTSFNTSTNGIIQIASRVPPGGGHGAYISNVSNGSKI